MDLSKEGQTLSSTHVSSHDLFYVQLQYVLPSYYNDVELCQNKELLMYGPLVVSS